MSLIKLVNIDREQHLSDAQRKAARVMVLLRDRTDYDYSLWQEFPDKFLLQKEGGGGTMVLSLSELAEFCGKAQLEYVNTDGSTESMFCRSLDAAVSELRNDAEENGSYRIFDIKRNRTFVFFKQLDLLTDMVGSFLMESSGMDILGMDGPCFVTPFVDNFRLTVNGFGNDECKNV